MEPRKESKPAYEVERSARHEGSAIFLVLQGFGEYDFIPAP